VTRSRLAQSLTAVTGASGFLGTHVCRTFAEKGYPVRALARTASRSPLPPDATAVADLADRDSLRRALAGVHTVVHLAARVHVMDERSADPAAAYQRVNVEGTRVLLDEAIRAGVRCFVFISSVKAVGETTSTPWTEDVLPAPVDPYGRSKLEAEQVVRAMANSAGIDAPILRLPLVYGPGMKANMLRLFQAVERGWPLPLGSVGNRRSLLYAGNLVAAIEAAAAEPNAGRETFFVSDGQDLSTTELVREISVALGRPARLVPVPPALFRAAGRAGDVLRTFMPFPLTTAALDRLFGSLQVDSSHLREVTGFRPPYTVPQGLRATAEWVRSGGVRSCFSTFSSTAV
jgi:nucleoside-diphosphate-sugar epimerase